jgi:hypothetical protein
MVEYGETIGRGPAGGTGSGGGGSVDVGGELTAALSDVVDRVAGLPPEVLLVLGVILLGGLLVLRRAF